MSCIHKCLARTYEKDIQLSIVEFGVHQIDVLLLIALWLTDAR